MSKATKQILYGCGVFSSIRVLNGEPFLWKKHWQRLGSDAAKVGIDLSEYSEENIRRALDEIIAKNRISFGRARITFVDDSPSDIWPTDGNKKTSPLIITAEMRTAPDNFRLTVSPYNINSRSPLAGIKSCNYLDKILALEEVKTRGFDEAIQINERGEITSATMANVFWLKDGVLHTPSLRTGCLPGTTREFVLENLDCKEVEAEIETIRNADAIFLTSAGIGIVAAALLDNKQLSRSRHPILDLIPNNR